MTFTVQELRAKLTSFGIPAWQWQLADEVYETVSNSYIPEVWEAWIDSLKRNAPKLLAPLNLGGGKTRMVPKWIKEAGDCENAAIICFAHAMTGNWLGAAQGGLKAGRTHGVTFFTAVPSAVNRNRAGGHAVQWWIDHAGEFHAWETGDGEEQPWVPAEYLSATFGIAG